MWAALPLLWLATALRFLRLDAQSFWNDEGNSARLAERSVRLIVEGAAGDVHPPLYYLLLAGWRQLLGDGEFELRAMSAFAGVLLVAGVFTLGRNSRRVALVGALLAAVHPALVYYSQETRMYALLGLWAVLSTLLLWRLLPRLAGEGLRRAAFGAAAYGATVAAGLYTHYFFPAVLAGHAAAVFLLLWREREGGFRKSLAAVRRWVLLVAASLILYLPWLPLFFRQTGGRAADGATAWEFIQNAAHWLTLGETAGDGLWLAVAAAWLLALLGMASRRGLGAVIAAQVLLPPLLMLALAATRPAYHKFMVVAAPFFCSAAAQGIVALWRATLAPAPGRIAALRWLLGAGLALLVWLALWGSGQSLENLYNEPAQARADYRGMAARIAAEAHPNAGIILNAANQWEVFTYYHRQGAPVYPIPRGQPDATRIAQELEQIAAEHDRLYALFWGEVERDPERLVERWLDANAFKAGEEWVGDVRFVTYAVAPEPAGEMAVELGAQFGPAITLAGYTLQGAGPQNIAAAPGDIVQVTLFWRTAQLLAQRYKVFLHLLPEVGPPLAQRDAEPIGNLAPTTTWQPGQVVVDNHGLLLPMGLPAGQYELRVGLYALEDATLRLPVRLPTGEAAGDSLLLGVVTVR